MVLEMWFMEIARGFGKIFIHPILYWTILFLLITGYKRISRERNQFGVKVYNLFAEIRHTFVISLIFSIIISMLTFSFGIVLSVEIITILGIVMVVLGITGSPTMLSASYTIGITFILLLLLPLIPLENLHPSMNVQNISTVHFICLAMLTGLFLLIEACIVSSRKSRQSFPEISLSERGVWIGQHQLKSIAFIPFFALLPTDTASGIIPLWPYFEFGGQTFSPIFLPFFLGYQYKAQSTLPSIAAQKIAQSTLFLSMVVILFAIGSLFFPILSFIAILIAIIGKEWMTYRHRINDRKKPAFFSPLPQGIKVLATIPKSPADRLGILAGETILKVNGIVITNSTQFYEALQMSGAFFKIDLLDVNGEIRLIRSALYEEDHHELGLIFPQAPYSPLLQEKVHATK